MQILHYSSVGPPPSLKSRCGKAYGRSQPTVFGIMVILAYPSCVSRKSRKAGGTRRFLKSHQFKQISKYLLYSVKQIAEILAKYPALRNTASFRKKFSKF
jgi:hypothetical protein